MYNLTSSLPGREIYQTETRETVFQDKTITFTSYTPIFTLQQRDKRKQNIEKSLFEVFRKYQSSQ